MNRKLLFVDDETRMLSLFKREFSNTDYSCLFASGTLEAFKILENEVIDCVISDINMPTGSGIDLFREMRRKYPSIVRIAISGSTNTTDLINAINSGSVHSYVSKPHNLAQLKLTIYSEILKMAESAKKKPIEKSITTNELLKFFTEYILRHEGTVSTSDSCISTQYGEKINLAEQLHTEYNLSEIEYFQLKLAIFLNSYNPSSKLLGEIIKDKNNDRSLRISAALAYTNYTNKKFDNISDGLQSCFDTINKYFSLGMFNV
jgi:response regulator RpfG family c-di-GMP phosphodiesterase